jgi:hypothetical protein
MSRLPYSGTKDSQRPIYFAQGDIRNYVTTMAMYGGLTDVPPELLFSFSPVAFDIVPANNRIWVLGDGPVPKVEGPIHTGISANYFAVHSADGDWGPFIYLLKLDHLDTSKFEFFKIPNLTQPDGTGPSSDGYIIFAPRCAATLAIYTKIFLEILIPYVSTKQKCYQEKMAGTSIPKAFVLVDGEPNAQLQAIVNCHDVLASLAARNVEVGKVPELCAQTIQPVRLGKSTWVEAVKKLSLRQRFDNEDSFLKAVSADDRDEDHARDLDALDKDLAVEEPVRTAIASILCNVKYNGYRRLTRQVCNGLTRLNMNLRTVLDASLIKATFADAGLFPFAPEKVLANCVPADAELTEKRGVKEDDPLIRQRAVLLTHPATIAKYGPKKGGKRKDPATDPDDAENATVHCSKDEVSHETPRKRQR